METLLCRPLFWGSAIGAVCAATLVAGAVFLPTHALVVVAASLGWIIGRVR